MTTLQNHFSAPANRVLLWTQAEAERLDHAQVEPEHLLLGLIEEKQGLAYLILQSLKIDLLGLEAELRQSLSAMPLAGGNKIELSQDARKVLELSMQSAGVLGRTYIGTEHMLVGLLRHIGSRAYPILRRMGVNYDEVLGVIKTMPSEIAAPMPDVQPVPPGERLSLLQIFFKISPVFWGLALLMGLSGAALYLGWLSTGLALFLFVTLGWVVSLSLHEFGHALTAYFGGDFTVVDKGYLTLNPLRYTHGALSILFPLIYLALGGIGLPGGAVYINHALIPSKRMRSLVSAAGPIMTGLFSLVVVIPFFVGVDQSSLTAHYDFWAGLAMLAFLQITALIFNLIPLPPLDGFGILRPFLPPSLVNQVYAMGRWTFFIIFFLFIVPNPLQNSFWQVIGIAIRLLNLDPNLIFFGLDLYRFWG